MTMIEKVARALHVSAGIMLPYGLLGADQRALLWTHARAAIEAMRWPTEEMKTAGDDEIPDNKGYSNDASGVYRAMIDAALGNI